MKKMSCNSPLEPRTNSTHSFQNTSIIFLNSENEQQLTERDTYCLELLRTLDQINLYTYQTEILSFLGPCLSVQYYGLSARLWTFCFSNLTTHSVQFHSEPKTICSVYLFSTVVFLFSTIVFVFCSIVFLFNAHVSCSAVRYFPLVRSTMTCLVSTPVFLFSTLLFKLKELSYEIFTSTFFTAGLLPSPLLGI